ncbi:hypothetical protein G6F59_015068 [Rhizopus arrhizus]|nr:hypothetical protein G6F59_015068 [Rhizopus arrhizus]
MLAGIRAAEGLAVLVFAVDGFHHQLLQHAVAVLGQQGIPVTAPQQLDHVPAAATEHAFQFLDDLGVAAHRAVQPLQVAIDHEDQVVQLFAPGHRHGGQRFGLVLLAVAQESPDLAALHGYQFTVLQIAHIARLIGGHQWPQAHRHRRELPELRHRARVRIRRQAAPADLAAEAVKLGFRNAAFQIGTRVDARG